MRDLMESRGGQALRAVLHECDHVHAGRFHDVVRAGLHEPAHRLIAEPVQRGIERGDVGVRARWVRSSPTSFRP
ncbi:hypothetical protein AB0D97_16050 [Streptomyces roseus]|uniref:hypothetical protein n=1 Tax=Streptomyces roseus TaxID=66430 RepID=UPI00341060CD